MPKTTVTITPALLTEIKNEQNRLMNLGQPEPRQGDLIRQAWDLYRERQNLSGTTIRVPTAALPEAQKKPAKNLSVPSVLSDTIGPITEEESGCVRVLLRLMRSGYPTFTEATEKWLEAGELSLRAVEEAAGGHRERTGHTDAAEADADFAAGLAEARAGIVRRLNAGAEII